MDGRRVTPTSILYDCGGSMEYEYTSELTRVALQVSSLQVVKQVQGVHIIRRVEGEWDSRVFNQSCFLIEPLKLSDREDRI